MAPPLATADAISTALAALPGFRQQGTHLRCRYALPDFAAAVALGARIAALAAAHDHHPDWTTRYREVEVATTTHDAGGITRRDLELAAAIAAAAAALGSAPVAADALAADTGLWAQPGHFYSPIPDPAELAADAARRVPRPRDLPGIDLRLDAQLALAVQLARCYGEEDFPAAPRADRRYCLANEYFGYGDAFVYHALLRHLAPRRVLEVGAGWSSAVLLDTDERWLGQRTGIAFVEPFPDRLLSLLRPADHARVRLLRQRVQDVAAEEFTRLGAGDVLFVDTSHVAKTGSDVVHLVCEVLPTLAPGVWVHFHDVHANFEYPESWVREGRAWNEAYFLRAFLQHNREFEIRLHAPTLALHAAGQLLPLMPRVGENVGGSLWLCRA